MDRKVDKSITNREGAGTMCRSEA